LSRYGGQSLIFSSVQKWLERFFAAPQSLGISAASLAGDQGIVARGQVVSGVAQNARTLRLDASA